MINRVVAIAALALLTSGAQAQQACRLALALGLDISGSVDATEYRLQLDGLAAALEAPEVSQTIFAMPQAPIMLAVFEWGTPGQERLLVNWTQVTAPQHLRAITTRLRATTGDRNDPATGIGAAMLYGAALLGRHRQCWRRTLDISGDGASNSGPAPGEVDTDLLVGITINGLVIGPNTSPNISPFPSHLRKLSNYYRTEVIYGAGAFVEIAQDFDDFEAAMIRKLRREIGDLMIGSTGAGLKGPKG